MLKGEKKGENVDEKKLHCLCKGERKGENVNEKKVTLRLQNSVVGRTTTTTKEEVKNSTEKLTLIL